jgi:TatA/E family protein of Tat protein translocase
LSVHRQYCHKNEEAINNKITAVTEAQMFGIGWQEVLVILILALLLFGAKRLPGIAKSLGSSIQEFKKGMDANNKAENDEKSETNKIEDKKDEIKPQK